MTPIEKRAAEEAASLNKFVKYSILVAIVIGIALGIYDIIVHPLTK
jgi:hypothetical protein